MKHEKTFALKQVKHVQQHDVIKVANSFQQAVSEKSMLSIILYSANVLKLDALHCCTGHYGVCILVCGDCSSNAAPIVTKTGEIGEFFKGVTNKTFLQLLEELNAWCTNGLRGISLFQHTIFNLISTGLAQGKKNIQECKKFCQNKLKLDLCQ